MYSAIDEQILLAAIAEGGSNPTNRFSMVKIAHDCGVSEFLVYDHFGSKELLLEAADSYLSKILVDFALEQAANCSDFEEFFGKIMNFQLVHPNWNGFLLNYSLIFPRFSPVRSGKGQSLINEQGSQALAKFFPSASPENRNECFRFVIRETISFARYVIYSEVAETPHRLHIEAQTVAGGLNAFKDVKEKLPDE